MRVGAIVQARLSSRRLPQKVMRLLHGKPLLKYLLESLERVPSLDTVVVATSSDPTDDALVRFCDEQRIACHRGALDDVAARFRETAHAYSLDAFVRTSGDSPLLDPRLVERGVALFRAGNHDVVTNVFPRSFPPGQSVEVLRASAFSAACASMTRADEREHVTLHFYEHPERYRIVNFAAEVACAGVRLCVDTADDLDVIETLVSRMSRPHWEYRFDELLPLYREAVGR